jgi:hypothetical protein
MKVKKEFELVRCWRIATKVETNVEDLDSIERNAYQRIVVFEIDDRFPSKYPTQEDAISDYLDAIKRIYPNSRRAFSDIFGEFTLIEVLEFLEKK